MPEQACDRTCGSLERGAHARADLLAGLVRDLFWRSLVPSEKSEGLHPMKGILAGAVYEELRLLGRTHIGEVHGGLSPMCRTPCWNRVKV